MIQSDSFARFTMSSRILAIRSTRGDAYSSSSHPGIAGTSSTRWAM